MSLICDDMECKACGLKPVRLTCSDCGATGNVVDCGHKAQPRPISASESPGGPPVCEPCERAREAARAERMRTERDTALAEHIMKRWEGAFARMAASDRLPAATDACRTADGQCDGSCPATRR